jgi:hypothetical protein
MHYRSENSGVAKHFHHTGQVQLALVRAAAFGFALSLSLAISSATADNTLPPAMDSVSPDAGAPPMSQSGGGDLNYYSQDLGTILRLRYSTQSYGQDGTGNFDLGTMQVVTMGDTAAFLDAQVTMNESDGVGFNIGVGYRWMNYPAYAASSGRMDGISLWADGTHTDVGNFFPQVGISYESLGEVWDVRANGYVPVGSNEQVGPFNPINQIGFQGNSISDITVATVDRSFASAEVEIARRLGAERDAWGFAGPYFVGNSDEDSAGFRAGVRGYAYPDLLLQFAVSDDDVFKTHATFSAVWFVGRTRTNYQPACGTPDRFREPVMRNDYVVLSHNKRTGGNPLTNTDGSALRVVHVASNAPAGGNGTVEHPFNELTDANGTGSQAGDIILAHSTSVFNGESSVILKDNQRLLGEGNNLVETVATTQKGTITIPESSPGARALARPQVNGSVGDAVTLANANEVANFDFKDINGKAISGTGLSGNANLHDFTVTNGTDFAVAFADVATTSTVTLDKFTYDGGTTSPGGVQLNNFDGSLTATTSTLTGGTAASRGVEIIGDSDGPINFASSVTFNQLGGTAVNIDGGAGDQIGSNITIAGDITDAAVSSVSVQGLAATGAANFSGNILSNTVTQSGDGIFVNSNATGAAIGFTGQLVIDTTADGFVAQDGGTIRATAANNTITTTTGQIAKITDMTIGSGDVRFSEVNNTVSALSALQFERNLGTGAIQVGTTTNTAGHTGTIASSGADTVVINNSANVTVTGVIVNNGAGFAGVHVTKNSTGTQTTNLNDLQINNGARGIDVTGGGAAAGTLNLTIADNAINDSTAFGLNVDNVDNGTVRVDNATIDGNPANAGAVGVRILNSNATFTFDAAPATDNTLIQNWASTDFEVDGGTPHITFNGSIVNASADNATDTTGRSVVVHNITGTGGSVSFSPESSIKDDNQGLLVDNNANASIAFLGTHDFDTSTADAITVTNNTGTTNVIFDGVDINTTSGRGVFINANASTTSVAFTDVDVTSTSGDAFTATGGGGLSVAGNNNVISTTTGRGLVLTGMNIVGGANFESVTVNGASNGIALTNVTGAQVTVGETAGAAHSGGTLATTGDAVVLTNTTNVDLLHMQITSAGGNGVTVTQSNAATTAMDVTIDDLDLAAVTGIGMQVTANDNDAFAMRLTDSNLLDNVVMTSTGSGHFGLLVDSTDINVGNVNAFDLQITGGASSDLTIRNGNHFTSLNGTALLINSNTSGAANSKLLVEDSFFTSTSATPTADIRSQGGTSMDATIQGNTFTNLGAGVAYDMRSNGASAHILLNLGGTGADQNSAGGKTFELHELGGSDFDIFERDATIITDSRNIGAVNTDPSDAEFDNSTTAPLLPTPP